MIISNFQFLISNVDEVKKYVANANKKTDIERADLSKEKTGVELKGIKAINPANGEELPIFVADYVITGYGTGAIMAVPAHDERDWEFAKKYNLPIRCVVSPYPASPRVSQILPTDLDNKVTIDQETNNILEGKRVWTGLGISINSGFLNSLKTQEAKTKMIAWL